MFRVDLMFFSDPIQLYYLERIEHYRNQESAPAGHGGPRDRATPTRPHRRGLASGYNSQTAGAGKTYKKSGKKVACTSRHSVTTSTAGHHLRKPEACQGAKALPSLKESRLGLRQSSSRGGPQLLLCLETCAWHHCGPSCVIASATFEL